MTKAEILSENLAEIPDETFKVITDNLRDSFDFFYFFIENLSNSDKTRNKFLN